VFSFALFGLLASGLALGGSPVPRWCVSVARRCSVSFGVLPFAGFFMSALVGFCGSRSLPSAFSPLVASCVSAFADRRNNNEILF